jgi:hypothetical protein
MDYRLADEPVAVLNAAIQELVGQQQAKAPAVQLQQQPAAAEVPHFLPVPRFLGPKQGYYFGTAEEGTGYVLLVPCRSLTPLHNRWIVVLHSLFIPKQHRRAAAPSAAGKLA